MGCQGNMPVGVSVYSEEKLQVAVQIVSENKLTNNADASCVKDQRFDWPNGLADTENILKGHDSMFPQSMDAVGRGVGGDTAGGQQQELFANYDSWITMRELGTCT